ncbi:sugar ABC transporter substrate-binding protein [Haloplasma contractile]|uniref:Periplasmic sugar-binding protein n=1 Tax=Haloplasma contractile SSD-17B TaxID=1033810 RepID=U2FJU6_9MOLU|nr:sugar-binding protein [Haloplasma contractile]ERJ13090.1 Periplasmic sugar-binding protein [Haloplasma contractile SSD-17B]
MKKLLSIITVFVVVATLAACQTAEKVNIGIVLPTKEEPRWVQDEARFRAALEDTDYSVEILFSQGDSAKEKSNVEALLSKGIDVLIIAPHDGAAAAAAIQSAKNDGVKVISYDRLVTDTDAVDYYITFDSKSVGAAQAEYLVEQAGDALVADASLPLFLYAGAASDNNAFLFFEGALEVLKPYIENGAFEVQNYNGNVDLTSATHTRAELADVINVITTNWHFGDAKNLAESNLTNFDQEDATAYVLAPNDGTARSIADVFNGDANISDYVITGQDAEEASIQYIIDGKQDMTVFKDVRKLVTGAIDMATNLLEGKSISTDGSYNNGEIDVPAVQVPVDVVDADNVQQILIDSGYYDADKFTWSE